MCKFVKNKNLLKPASPKKEMGPHGEGKQIYDPGGIRTHDLRERSPLL